MATASLPATVDGLLSWFAARSVALAAAREAALAALSPAERAARDEAARKDAEFRRRFGSPQD